MKYRPSNGTEGDIFHAEWCYKCAKYQDPETEEYCSIIHLVHAFDVEDKEYPDQWCYDEQGNPQCTSFIDQCDEVKKRCSKTSDMFGG